MEVLDHPVLWGGFGALLIAMLVLDLLVLGGGKTRRVTVRQAAGWSAGWVALALLFAAGLWWYVDAEYGRLTANQKTTEFITGYLIEKALAVDNVFVWLMIFSYFALPMELQRRVLVYGVVGAVAMRTVMILAGGWLIAEFHWILYLFGLFLLATGVKMLWLAQKELDFSRNPLLLWMSRNLRVTHELHAGRFWIRQDGLVYFTPLFLALVLVEVSDLIFAVDSIPAIFAVTKDPFIVLTSNIFAILGLRAMYFLVADVAGRFSLLKYGLALVMIFIGGKMLLVDLYKIPVGVSLGVVAGLVGGSIVLSLCRGKGGAGPLATAGRNA